MAALKIRCRIKMAASISIGRLACNALSAWRPRQKQLLLGLMGRAFSVKRVCHQEISVCSPKLTSYSASLHHQQLGKGLARRDPASQPPLENALSSLCQRLGLLGLGTPVPPTRMLSTMSCSMRCNAPHTVNKSVPQVKSVLTQQPHRTVIRYSRNFGKKKTTKAVIERFCRLESGLWVRTQAGRAKKLWKKSPRQRHRLKQHVFCSKTQSKMLDRMVCGFWKKRRHYLDDPFEQYHERNFDGQKMWHGGRPKSTTGSTLRPSEQ